MYKDARKVRRNFYIPLVLILALAGTGIWAGLEFMKTGEIALPMPEQAASFLSRTLNLGDERKIGPIRLGSAPPPAAPEALENPEQADAPTIKMPLSNQYSTEPALAVTADSAAADLSASSVQPDPSARIAASANPESATADSGATAPDVDAPIPNADASAPASSFNFPLAQIVDDPKNTGETVRDGSAESLPATPSADADSSGAQGYADAVPPGPEISVPPPVATPPRPPRTLSRGRPQISSPDPNWKGKEPVTPYVPLSDAPETASAVDREEASSPGQANAGRPDVRPEDKALFAELEKPIPAPVMGKGGGPRVTVPLPDDAAGARGIIPATFGPDAAGAGGSGNPGTEDSVVTLGFVKDLAAYLTSCYWPAGTHPNYPNKSVSTANIKNINQRYGIDLRGFSASKSGARDYYRDRNLILNYVFMPSMLEALTRIYADRFADLLAQAGSLPVVDNTGKERRLTAQQNIAMLNYYSADAKALGAALQAYAETPDASARVEEYNKALNAANLANTKYLDASAVLEIARNSGNTSRIEEARRNLEAVETDYQARLNIQKSAENAVYKMMLKGAATRLDSSSLVYIACWLNRRASDRETILAASASSNRIAAALAARTAPTQAAK
jgi:hypothetical protein